MRRRRAAALSALLTAWRWRVEPWGTGYAVHGPVGALPPADGVDDVVARAAAARPPAFAALVDAIGAGPGPGLAAADAVARASVVALAHGAARLCGPGVDRPLHVRAHRGARVALLPGARGWRVAQ